MKANKKWMTRIGAGVGVAALTVGALTGVANAHGSSDKGERKGGGPVAALVTEGTLTTDQATAVGDALKSAREAAKADHLSSLVAAGTITQAQADALSEEGGIKALVQSGDMTREEAKALYSALKAADKPDMESNFASVMSALVADGTITQAQADAITAAKPAKGEKGSKGGHGKKGGHGNGADKKTANGATSSAASA